MGLEGKYSVTALCGHSQLTSSRATSKHVYYALFIWQPHFWNLRGLHIIFLAQGPLPGIFYSSLNSFLGWLWAQNPHTLPLNSDLFRTERPSVRKEAAGDLLLKSWLISASVHSFIPPFPHSYVQLFTEKTEIEGNRHLDKLVLPLSCCTVGSLQSRDWRESSGIKALFLHAVKLSSISSTVESPE